MAKNDSLKLKVQVYCGDEIAMGPGKADLLDAIALHGSISAAARAMKMSYRRAWLLVDAMNRCWREPLVETSPGRARGSGARLSDAGREVLGNYRKLQASVIAAAHGGPRTILDASLREEPRVRASES